MKLKEVLELMMPEIVREYPFLTLPLTDSQKEVVSDISKTDIVPLETQIKVLNDLLPFMYEEEEGYYSSLTCENRVLKDIEVPTYNFFFMNVECKVLPDTTMYNTLHIKGFDTYYELKSYIDTTLKNFTTFKVYVKSLDGFKRVDFKGDYDEKRAGWSNFSIPSLAEFFPITITNENYNIVIPYYAAIIPSLDRFKEYISFSFAELMIKDKPLNFNGYIAYENKKYYYNFSFNGLTTNLTFNIEKKEEIS